MLVERPRDGWGMPSPQVLVTSTTKGNNILLSIFYGIASAATWGAAVKHTRRS